MKAKHTFLELCKSPELALEISMQPMRILAPDAAIVFADILLPAEMMGITIDFNPGPKVHTPIKSAADVSALRGGDPFTALSFVMQTISALRSTLASHSGPEGRPAVLGFAGAPWTMSCYLVDQGVQKHFQGTEVFAVQQPTAFKQLMQRLVDITSDYLLAQIESGADAVQLFDSWAGNLSLEEYRALALPFTQSIVAKVKKSGAPIILYANGSSHLLDAMIESGADCVSVDWRTPLADAQQRLGSRGTIQGNLNPCSLFGSREQVVAETRKMLASVPRKSGYIANLGHGILQQTPPENAKAFIDTVQAGWPVP